MAASWRADPAAKLKPTTRAARRAAGPGLHQHRRIPATAAPLLRLRQMLSIDPSHCSVYSPRARKWIHQVREPCQAEALAFYPLSDPETIIRPSRATRQTLSRSRSYRAQKWWSRCLAQDVPEMGPALGFIGDLLEESHVVSTHSEMMDPAIGKLLAFGKAVDVENKSTRLLDIAAFADGPIGADLRVGAVTERVLGVEGTRGLVLGVPRIFEGGEVVWSWGSAIQQVVFAGGVGGNVKSNLAVRTTGGTTILRQTRLQSPPVGQSHPFVARRLVDIDTGDAAHVHVDFNPWYERQVAIIDESGKWKIWDIEGRQASDSRMRRDLALEEYVRGHITPTDEVASNGWGRVVWGGDLNTIMACDRRRAGLFDIRSPESDRPNIPLPTDPHWILDLKHGPSYESHGYDAFVLTSTALTWVDIRQSGKPLMNVPHYRHHDDHSLSMELLDMNDTTIAAFLHSRFNTLVTTHRFVPSETPAVLGTPKIFPSPIPEDAVTPVSYGVSILPCRAFSRGKTDETADHCLADPTLRFFTAFGIGKGLGVTQRLYASKDLLGDAAPDGGFKLVSRTTDKVGARARSSRYVVEDDPDAEMELEMRGLSFGGKDEDADTPYVEFGNPCVGDRNWSNRLRVDFAGIYRYAFLADQDSLKTATGDDAENSIGASVAQIKALLEKRIDRGDLGIISLLNLRQPAHLYDRLDEFESRIRDLLELDSLGEYKIKSLIPAAADEFFTTHASSSTDPVALVENSLVQISIAPLYTKLLETWVHPLPDATPGKVRLRRERLCRMLATEMWLSSIGLHLEPSPESLPPPPPPPPPAPTEHGGEQPDTVPPEHRPEPLQRIRTYANVSTRITLPQGLADTLDRWEVGEDPWEYEYAPDDGIGANRRKKRRRKSAVRKGDVDRVRGDVENWSLQLSASQPPPIAISSQQQAAVKMGAGGGSSQVEVVVMSQVERGKHGGRVAARKKRKTGF